MLTATRRRRDVPSRRRASSRADRDGGDRGLDEEREHERDVQRPLVPVGSGCEKRQTDSGDVGDERRAHQGGHWRRRRDEHHAQGDVLAFELITQLGPRLERCTRSLDFTDRQEQTVVPTSCRHGQRATPPALGR
jgi:hypothetical protein